MTGQGSNPFVAVKDLADAHVSGAIVYWRIVGTVDYEDLEAAWLAAALDAGLLPAPPSRETALKRALADVARADEAVRPVKADRPGFVLVRELFREDGKPVYTHGTTAYLGGGPGGVAIDAVDDNDTVDALRARFAVHLNTLAQQDVSGWLVDLVRGVRAVRLRDTGGLYFVPRDELPRWRAYVGAVRRASRTQLFEIPALHSEEAVAAVMDALAAEAEQVAAAVDADLLEAIDAETLTARGWRGREKRIRAVEDKVAAYEALLGVKMAALHERFGRLQARVAAAMLAEMAEGVGS